MYLDTGPEDDSWYEEKVPTLSTIQLVSKTLLTVISFFMFIVILPGQWHMKFRTHLTFTTLQ